MPRELLVPGALLPEPQPGRLHGTISRIVRPPDGGGDAVAVVSLTDLRGVRVQLPLQLAESLLIPKPPKRKRPDNDGAPRVDAGRPAVGRAGGGTEPDAGRPEAAAAHPTSPGTPPTPAPARALPYHVPRYGPGLRAAVAALDARPAGGGWLATAPPGTRVWCRLAGVGPWPGVVWTGSRCGHRDLPDLLASHRPGCVLIFFYGERSLMWSPTDRVEPWDARAPARPLAALAAWARAKRKAAVGAAVADDVALSCDDPVAEAARLEESRARADVAAAAAAASRRAAAAAAAAACDACRDPAADGPGGDAVACADCLRAYHVLCLDPPALSTADLPGGAWACLACGAANVVAGGGVSVGDAQAGAAQGGTGGVPSAVGDGGSGPPGSDACGGSAADGDGSEHVTPGGPSAASAAAVDPARAERMGLTPDWIIEAACFSVFRLPRPSPARPYIAGLLDPKRAPNIPAEVLYDKVDDGLRLSNAWRGHHVLLNPDFRAAVQWRFVNRAIDEVENGQVPAVLLVCRNSTDTGYFQRLRPYPRVLLRRNSALFKDYDKTPIGFGIVVVLLAKGGAAELRGLYTRFYDAFAPMGEPNVPVDRALMAEPAFYALLDRLRDASDRTLRDHWAQCTACAKWRQLPYEAARAAAAADWTCADLDPPRSSCATPQSRAEADGVHYAPRCAGESGAPDEGQQVGDGPVLRAGGRQGAGAVGAEGGGGGVGEGGGSGCWAGDGADENEGAGAEAPHTEAGAEPLVAVAGPSSPWPPRPPCTDAVLRAARLPPVSAGATRPLEDGEWEVLTSLELARHARIAANRAYLAGLGLLGGGGGSRSPAGSGTPAPALPPDDPAVLLAARELARKAAAASAAAQLEAVRARWEAGERVRRGRMSALRSELASLEAQAASAAAELEAAKQAAAAFDRGIPL